MIFNIRFFFLSSCRPAHFCVRKTTPVNNTFYECCLAYARMHWEQTAELIVHAFASILKINNLLHEAGAMISAQNGLSTSHLTPGRSRFFKNVTSLYPGVLPLNSRFSSLFCFVLFCC